MKDYFKLKTWLIAAAMFIIAFGLSSAIVYFGFGLEKNIQITSASEDNNVDGWAWNANTGWISFNCTNDSPACSGTNYGVSIDVATGEFSGYAWSSSVGWISFNRGDAGDPPGQPYQNGTFLAKYTSGTGQVDGWAKILSLGANGWIKFRKFSADTGGDYGVTINPADGEFSGWAWNANDSGGEGIGWISFNCSNESPACSGTNYKVVGEINNPPAAADLTAPNWNYAQAATNALRANLQFSLVDPDPASSGSAYQVIVRKGADDSLILDTGKCTGYNIPASDPIKCKFDNSICMQNGATGCISAGDCECQFSLDAELNYNTAYKWSVQVWDNYDTPSVVVPYNTSPDTDNNDSVAATFTTYKHKFPLPSATYFPVKPSRGEEVKFTDTSVTFATAAPTAPIACDDSICDRRWTVPAGATIDSVSTSTPTIVFNTAGLNSVKLKITDRVDNYYSEVTFLIDVNAKLPGWKEVKPE